MNLREKSSKSYNVQQKLYSDEVQKPKKKVQKKKNTKETAKTQLKNSKIKQKANLKNSKVTQQKQIVVKEQQINTKRKNQGKSSKSVEKIQKPIKKVKQTQQKVVQQQVQPAVKQQKRRVTIKITQDQQLDQEQEQAQEENNQSDNENESQNEEQEQGQDQEQENQNNIEQEDQQEVEQINDENKEEVQNNSEQNQENNNEKVEQEINNIEQEQEIQQEKKEKIEENNQEFQNTSNRKNSSSNNVLKIDTGNFVNKLNYQDFLEKYEKISDANKLGEGNEGSIHKLALIENPDQYKAVKVLKKDKVLYLYKEKFLREIELLKQLDNPYVNKVYEFYESEDAYFIITDYIEGKDLLDEILSRKTFIEKDAANIMQQIFSALSYIHEKGIVHRDLKYDNVMIEKEETNSEDNQIHVKLIDFGVSGKIENGQSLKQSIGTFENCAPEVIQQESYDEKCDMWSAGVLLYVILGQEHPFLRSNQESTSQKILQGEFSFATIEFTTVSEEAKDLIKQLLVVDPKKRLSAQEAYNHEWIQNNIQKEQNQNGSSEIQLNLDQLRKYKVSKQLQQTVLSFIASHLISDKEKKQLRNTFRHIDTNGDGKLSKDEIFQSFVKQYGKTQAQSETDKIFESIDRDNNGYIDYNEFLTAAMDKKDKFTKKKMRKTFQLFDKDNDGEITVEELKQVFGINSEEGITQSQENNLQEEQQQVLLKIIEEVDEDKNGQISFEEFESFILKVVEQTGTDKKEIITDTQEF